MSSIINPPLRSMLEVMKKSTTRTELKTDPHLKMNSQMSPELTKSRQDDTDATTTTKTTNGVISDTNVEIDRKIKEGVKSSHDDKKRLQNRIKQLDKRQQLHLFHTIIKPLNIYTITDNGTFFDLNELSPEEFWKLSYHVNLTYDCIQRDLLRSELEKNEAQDKASIQAIYNQEYDIESEIDNKSTITINAQCDETVHLSEDQIIQQPPSYSQLREVALRTCQYKKSEPSLLSSEYESKVLERNIYTDKRKR